MDGSERPQSSDDNGVARSLQFRFSLGVIVIVLSLSGLLSYGLYKELERTLVANVYDKSELILAELEATRQYVRDILRPKIASIVPPEEFILEAMSTSYITRSIMDRFRNWHPDFSYKRAALDPRNPTNTADSLEKEVMKRLAQRRALKDWQGMVSRNGDRYIVRMTPIFMEKRCLRCHGVPRDAPEKLIRIYGDKGGFGKKAGDIAGLNVLSFPVESAMSQIKKQSLALLGAGGLAAVVILLLTALLFKRLVVNRIGTLKSFFKEFVSEGKELESRLKIDTKDEIGEVYSAFNLMADRLQSLMKQRHDLVAESFAQEEKIRSVFDAITDRLMLIAPDFTVLMANTAALNGQDRLKPGTKCYQLLHRLDDPCAGCLLPETVKEKEPVFGETNLPDGETYLSHFYPIRDMEGGGVKSVVHYCKSITEKKLMERHMMQAEKLAALGQLVSGAAHELNNPLGIILFYAGMLKSELPQGTEQLEDIEIVERHAEACKTIVEDLLTFAGTVETRTTPTDLNESLEEVLAVLEKKFEKENVYLKKYFACDLPRIPMDPVKIRQVWVNLLLNAKQATDRGTISITTIRDDLRHRLGVVIADEGEGIPPEIIHRIFDPFFTTKTTGEGTGLGLSVSYGIVKEHNGEILVKSIAGGGSVFEVWLPQESNGAQGAR